MGSLSYAVAGGMAGLGGAMEKVGSESYINQLISDREATHERLRADLAAKNQQAEQERAQTFQHGETEIAAGRNVAAAGAQRQFLTEQEKAKEAAAQRRTETTGQYRVKARVAGAPAKAPPKTWTPGHYQLQGSYDPVSKQLIPGATIPIMQHRDGRIFVQAGDKFMLYDATKGTQLPDAKSIGRTADPRAVQDITNDPTGTTPDGSETKADAFYRAYHYLPASYFSAAQRYQDRGPAGGPLGKNAPPGSTYIPGAPFGGGNASANAQDAEDDGEEYANTGDEGPQASDNEPAQ